MDVDHRTRAELIEELAALRASRGSARCASGETHDGEQDRARYLRLFEDSPVSLWEEDVTDLFAHLRRLRSEGVTDFEDYFEEHPEEVAACAAMVEVLEVNRATLHLHEARSKEELLGNVDKTFTENSFDVFRRELISIANGHTEFESDAEVAAITGERRDVRLRFTTSTVRLEGEQRQIAVVAILDMTDRRRAEAEKKRLEQRLYRIQRLDTVGVLAAGIAHDFNNTLTPIMGYAEMGLAQLSVDDPLHEDLEHVLKSANRAKGLVEQMLLFSRQSISDRREIDMVPIVKQSMKLLRSSIPATIRIEEDLATHCDRILGDATQIQQLIMNLCTNAWEAMEGMRGVLSIRLESVDISAEAAASSPYLQPGRYVALTVTDTGRGMGEATQDRIFEPYFTTKGPDRGVGMGLSVVHGIVRDHGGEIEVSSAPGNGSVVRVLLPVMGHELAADTPPTIGDDGRMEAIMVVDDDESVARLVTKMLVTSNYRVETYLGAEEALEAIRLDPARVELVLSDLTMPDLTGVELAREIHRIRLDLPVILMTGYGENVSNDALDRNGIHEILGKPINLSKLKATLRGALELCPAEGV